MKWLFAPRPIDYAMRATRTEHLAANAKAYVAYDKLERHYWHCGALYREDRELATVSGLSVTSFRLVKGLLLRLFDVDETGLWRDYDLERDRDDTIRDRGLGDPAAYQVLPDPVAPGEDSARMRRSKINFENANRGWATRRAARRDLSTVQDEGRGENAPGDHPRNVMPFASEPMQNPMRNTMRIASETDAEAGADSHGFASSHLASSLDDDDDDSTKSSSSSSNPGGPATDANAKSDANSHPVASQNQGERAMPILKDAELLDIFLVATGNKVDPRLRNIMTMKPYRELMRQGCDLERHIVPEWEAVRTLNVPLQQPCPTWMRDQILARRDAPVQQPAPAGSASAHRIWVFRDTPQDRAWRAYRKTMDGRPFTLMTSVGGKEGWTFAAEWPPGSEPAQASTTAAA